MRRDQAMGDPLLAWDPCDELNEALTYKVKPFSTDDLRMVHVPMGTCRLQVGISWFFRRNSGADSAASIFSFGEGKERK